MRFAPSARGTLGVEWELALVDTASRELVPAATEVLAAVDDPRVKGEFLTNTVELVTGVHHSTGTAIDELRRLRDAVCAACDAIGVAPIGAGTHPTSPWRDQQVSSADRYRRLVDLAGAWARRLAIFGVHVHVGLDAPERQLVPAMHALEARLPHVLALSASSPFWQGEDSGYASQRTMLFQQLPSAGIPPRIGSWDEWCTLADAVVAHGVVRELAELRWDVRPSPRFGTIESRIPDGAPSIDDLAAATAVTHCIVEAALQAVDAGDVPGPQPEWLLREQRWRAARHGLDASLLTADGEVPMRDAVQAMLDALAPIADDIGATDGIEAARRVLADGGPAARQRRRAATGSLHDVVDLLIDEARR